jgi:hypothetical protein
MEEVLIKFLCYRKKNSYICEMIIELYYENYKSKRDA